MSVGVGIDNTAIVGSIAAREAFATSAQASGSPDGQRLLVDKTNKGAGISSDLAAQLAASRETHPSLTAAAFRTANPAHTLSPLFAVRKFIF